MLAQLDRGESPVANIVGAGAVPAGAIAMPPGAATVPAGAIAMPTGATVPVGGIAMPAGATVPAGSPTAPMGIVLRPSVFQGSVSLRVGPLNDISQVDTLEIALLQVPGAEHVEVKEFSGRDAVAEIRLFQPVRLVEELHRVLPFSFEVTGGDTGSLTLLAGGEPRAPDAVNQTLTAAR